MIHQKSSFNYARQGCIIILQTPIKGLYSLRFHSNISCSVFLFISIYAKRELYKFYPSASSLKFRQPMGIAIPFRSY